jgi:DNA primase
MIERDKIEEIKRQTDIAALIGQYIPLKKVGKNYRALCPFHSEREPSFYVSPDKGIYYCFGCKKGGNAISFLMEYEKLDFPTAVKKLAKELGIEIDTTKNLKHKELYDVNELAAQFYTLCLSKELGRRGRNYLKERRIDVQQLKEFKLGYAPPSGGLVTYVRQKGVALEQLEKAGLISAEREIFRDRIMFPIMSVSGRVVGFGGRSIDEHSKPKYLNSPETPIFKKGSVLYGLYQSKQCMREKNEALLVEGYFDLLSVFQYGIGNVCAPLGTALTEDQAALISRFAKRVNILFDGDVSGIKAALRAIGLLINAQVDVFVTALPDGSDPDTYVREHGAAELKEKLSAADDFFHFYKKVVTVDTVEQEVVLIKDLIKIISNIRDPIRLDRYLKYAAHVFDIPVETIQREMSTTHTLAAKPQTRLEITPEEKLMGMILNAREHFALVKNILKPRDFADDGLRRLYTIMLRQEDFDIADVADTTGEVLKEKLLSIIMKEAPINRQALLEALVRYKSGIETKKIEAKIREARERGDDKAWAQYQKRLNDLKKQMLKINLDNVGVSSGL